MSPLELALRVPQLEGIALAELKEIRDELGEAEWQGFCQDWLAKTPERRWSAQEYITDRNAVWFWCQKEAPADVAQQIVVEAAKNRDLLELSDVLAEVRAHCGRNAVRRTPVAPALTRLSQVAPAVLPPSYRRGGSPWQSG